MRISANKTRHRMVRAGGLEVFVREAGDPSRPAVLLLHGFPSSSHSFRNLIPLLADDAYLIAPDMPGFGFSDSPPQDRYEYSFKNIADTIEALVEELALERMFLYVHDFGAPVAYELALRRPDRVLGLIVQNGNAHDEGLGAAWDATKTFWADPSPENRAKLPEWLNFEGTRYQYIGDIPEHLQSLIPPECWHLDWERMSRPGNIDIQFALFEDYRTHVARFADISRYHREHQPPCLITWGRHDSFFELAEVMAYAREIDRLEIHVFDGPHLLLETHYRECAEAIARFVAGAV